MKLSALTPPLFAALITCFAVPVAAAVPTTSAIEGVLLSSGGGPAADGNYTVAISIYGAETGGSAVWTETGVTIAAKGGQFSYQIGSKTPLSAAALSMPKAWVGIQIGTDPELPRKPLGSSPYALRAAIAEDLECTGCLKAGDLDPGILQPYAKAADLGAYAKTADLSAYAKSSDLGAYAKTSDLSSYAKAADLADYVKATSLAKVAGTGSYNDLKDLPTLAKVATSGSYADLTNQPKLPQLGAACGTDLVMKGIKTDGSYECVAAGIAADMINEVSNDLIWNQFVDKTDGTKDVQIKDGFSAGVTDTLNFPDIGTAQKIWVEFSAGNSDISKLTVELFAPGMSTPYILYKGSKTGTTLTAKYNDTDKLDTGDMNKDWLGKNIKGNWSITVKDTLAISVPPGTPPFVYDGKFNWSVNIQTLSSKKIQIKGNLMVDKELTATGAINANGGVKLGLPTATCSSTVEGTLRYDLKAGLQVCSKNLVANGTIEYAWGAAMPTKPTFSGGCQQHSQGTGWATYCLNGSDFNTLGDYLDINANGTMTAKISGLYRFNFYALQHGCGQNDIQFVHNGTGRAYNHIANRNNSGWQQQGLDQMWQLKKGDTFYVAAYRANDYCNGDPYRWHYWNSAGNHSRLQVSYEGQLVN